MYRIYKIMSDVDIQKLRRFTLSFGLILFAYSITGIEIETPARISPFGLPLIIKRPNLLGWGLFIAAIYGSARYFYYASIIRFSPLKRRKILKSGHLIDKSVIPGFPADMDAFMREIIKEVAENFPSSNKIKIESASSNGTFIVRIPRHIRFLSLLEDCDYFSPIWFNLVAVLLFVYHAVLR